MNTKAKAAARPLAIAVIGASFIGPHYLFADSLVAASAQLEVASAEWLPIRLQTISLLATSL
jgi:hypothetical protein